MKSTATLLGVFVILASSAGLAAPVCSNGSGRMQRDLPEGFRLEIGRLHEDKPGQCDAVVRRADDSVVAEVSGAEVGMASAPVRDINQDGKPDLVIVSKETLASTDLYSIVSLGEPAGLLRSFHSPVEVSFEDRDGDGKVEIITRDTAFANFDGLPDSYSPYPLVYLRMRGQALINVSQVFWPEYEREIAQARGKMNREAVNRFGGFVYKDKQVQGEITPREEAQVIESKGLVLEVILNQLYGGRGQEAWATVSELWPPNDRQRIRQAILKARMQGILGEVSRPVKPLAPAAQAAAQPEPAPSQQ